MHHLYLVFVILLVGGAAAVTVTFAQGDLSIPPWIKDTAVWWGQGAIGDSEFVNLVQFLIDRNLITVPIVNQSQIQELEDRIDQLRDSRAADIQSAYDRGYADGKNAVVSVASPPSSQTADPSTLGIIHGTVTKNIDGNTIEISGERKV